MEYRMSRNLLALSLTASLLAGPAAADVPDVSVDIAPVHSLVARVMADVASPALIVAPGASPHEYSLRPSEAQALQDAELVFWVGPELTPWLGDAIGTLAGGAEVIALSGLDVTMTLPIREGALFEAHDHDHGGHDDQAHEDHDQAHDDHGHDHAHEDQDDHVEGHEHGAHDPHLWLSPENAAAWLNVIAARLSAADPENAGAYFANAAAAQAELDALSEEIDRMLAPVRGGAFIVFHDAYRYFEAAFDVPASGAISLSDATDPSPARIAGIQARIEEQNVTCVLSEPQFDPGIVAAVMGDGEARTGVLDPLGSDLAPGPDLYPQVLRNLARTLAECLA